LIYSYGPYGAGVKEPSFRIKGEFIKWSNQLILWTSASGKQQKMSMKIWTKTFRCNNTSGKPLTENDVKNAKTIIAKIWYPYPNSNENVINLISIEE
jgi:hypothetical protein